MDAEWISQHALSIWAVLLAVALLGADVGWRRAVRDSGRPDWPAALTEDLLALGLAYAACAAPRRS